MTQTTIDLDWLISVDDHVLEPPGVWQDRVPANRKDEAPRLVTDDQGEAWVYDGKRLPTVGLSAAAGKRKEEFTTQPVTYADMRPGCYDPLARVEDMNRAGILASLSFPSFPRFCGQIFHEAKDKDLALLCVRAYNDWMIDEWCASAPGRYIPLVLFPLWDPALAVTEIERCAAKGARAIAFSENPEPLGLPSIHDPGRYWDPVLTAAAEAELVVCMHVGSSSTMPAITSDSPPLANMAWGAIRTAGTMLSWLFSGYFQRLPKLKIALSEGGVGWMPYFLERAEQVVDKQRFWATRGESFSGYGSEHAQSDNNLDGLDVRKLFRDHVYGCFIEDVHGMSSLDVLGVDNVMVETDYPHTDSTWPDSIDVARKQVGHLPPEVQYKLLRGNAERLYRFTPADPPNLPDRARGE
jgi:predicted TIM-barrel fold metal-dependent hydrolase